MKDGNLIADRPPASTQLGHGGKDEGPPKAQHDAPQVGPVGAES